MTLIHESQEVNNATISRNSLYANNQRFVEKLTFRRRCCFIAIFVYMNAEVIFKTSKTDERRKSWYKWDQIRSESTSSTSVDDCCLHVSKFYLAFVCDRPISRIRGSMLNKQIILSSPVASKLLLCVSSHKCTNTWFCRVCPI